MSRQSYLVFSLHGSLLAIDATVVRETIRLPELTSLEETPPYIVGVINIRGRILPVMDLKICFGHERQKYLLTDSIVVTEREGIPTGIIVSGVHDVIDIATDDIEPVAPYLKSVHHISAHTAHHSAAHSSPAQPHRYFIAGQAKVGEDIIMILNHDSIMQNLECVICSGENKEEFHAAPLEKEYFCPEAGPEEKAIFHGRALNLIRAVDEESLAGLTPIAVVGLCGEYFGVELESVREFANIRNFTPIPCCPKHIVGNMNLRGSILTLLDIRHLLDLPAGRASALTKAVVAFTGNAFTAVAVEDIFDVVYLNPSDVIAAPSISTGDDKFIKGTVPYEGRVMTLLDLPNIVVNERLIVDEKV